MKKTSSFVKYRKDINNAVGARGVIDLFLSNLESS